MSYRWQISTSQSPERTSAQRLPTFHQPQESASTSNCLLCHKNREIQKQSGLERQYSITPSSLGRLSLVQSVLTIAMHFKILQHNPPLPTPHTPNPRFWERNQNKHEQSSLGELSVWREQGDTEAALCWSPFSKLSLFNVSLKQPPHPHPTPPTPVSLSRSKVGVTWGFRRLLSLIGTMFHS